MIPGFGIMPKVSVKFWALIVAEDEFMEVTFNLLLAVSTVIVGFSLIPTPIAFTEVKEAGNITSYGKVI